MTVAWIMGQDPECVFKTLVARGASGGLYVFDIPVADSLDLKMCIRDRERTAPGRGGTVQKGLAG